MEGFPKIKNIKPVPKKAEVIAPDDLTPAQEPNIDNKITQTKEQGLGEDGAAPVKKTDSEDDSELSGGPAPGPDPFVNIRKKYGSEQNTAKTSQPSEPEESSDSQYA